ncbi:MAG: hypothetical protein M0R03_22315 [Novosphingobium sp.]|nr:hypothetical protein [Novosphingobium sp.]
MNHQDEINRIAAELLGSGEASTPADAAAKAEKLVRDRLHRTNAADEVDLVKRFDSGGPIIGGHGV